MQEEYRLETNSSTEKPMTIDSEKCRAILQAIESTGKKLRVTFNYRWAPGPTKVKQLLQMKIADFYPYC